MLETAGKSLSTQSQKLFCFGENNLPVSAVLLVLLEAKVAVN